MLELAAAVSDIVNECMLTTIKHWLQIESSEDIDDEMEKILEVQQEKHPHSLLHAVAYY